MVRLFGYLKRNISSDFFKLFTPCILAITYFIPTICT